MRLGWWIVMLALVFSACIPKKKRVVAPLGTMADVVEASRARPTANPVQARFNINVKSKPLGLAFTTGGGLFIERPGNLYLAVLGPFGGPQLALGTDGGPVGILVARDKLYMTHDDMPALVDHYSQAALTIDDVLALLVGTMPFSDERIRKTKADDDVVRIELNGPQNTRAEVEIDGAEGTLRTISVRDDHGDPLLVGTWESYLATEEGLLVPARLTVEIPRYEMTVDLKFKSWKPLEQAPDVFKVVTPEGYEEISLLEQLEKMAQQPLEPEAVEEPGAGTETDDPTSEAQDIERSDPAQLEGADTSDTHGADTSHTNGADTSHTADTDADTSDAESQDQGQ